MLERHPISLLGLALVAMLVAGCGQDAREVTTTSDAAFACYEDGTSNVERFRLEPARECFREAIEHDPEFAMAWAQLAIMQRRLGEVEAADESIRRAYEARENATEIESLWIARVHALFERDHEAAGVVWKQLVERYPEHPWVLRLRAEFAKQNNDYDLAIECYDKLLEQDPQAVQVHNLKGYLYLSQGDYEKAILSLQRYAYYAPDQANPHDSLGEAFLHTGRYEEAILEFGTALDLDPAFLWSARNMAEALSVTGQTNAAVKVLENFRPLFEERRMIPWWDMARATVAFRAGQWNKLLELTDQSLQRLSDLGEQEKLEYELFARYVRTIALIESDKMDAAREAATELGRVAQRVRDLGPVASLERPQQIMAINEALVAARFDRAEGVPAEGIPRLKSAIESAQLSPHELAWPVRELALAHLAAGQPEEAADAAQSILDAIPTSPGLTLVAARAEAAAGNREAALGYLQTYLDVMRHADPGHREVEEATALVQHLTPRS